MNTLKYFFITIGFVMLVASSVMAQEDDYFSAGELNAIHSETVKLLTDYNTKIHLLGDVDELVEEKQLYIASFVDIFFNQNVSIFNDLDPTGKTSPSFNPETYANNIMLFYPTFGMEWTLKFETIKFGTIKLYTVGQYAFDIRIDKDINGFYMDKTANRKVENLQFRIIFDRKGAMLDKFKIAGIRQVNATEDEVFIDKKWWESNSEQWKKLLRNALGFEGDPQEKDIMAIRQFVLYNTDLEKFYNQKKELEEVQQYIGNEKMIFSPRAFGLAHIVAEVEPFKKKKKFAPYNGIVLDENYNGNIKMQEKNGKIRILSKEIYRVKQRKTPEQIKTLKEQVAKLELDSIKYTLILDNGFIMPVTIVEKSTDFTKLKAKSPAIGNKELDYTIFEISEIILPVKRKGLYINAHGTPGYSIINDKNIEIGSERWARQKSAFGMGGGVGAEYYLTENFGIGIGAGVSSFTSTYYLNSGQRSQGTVQIPYTDGTNDEYTYSDSISNDAYVKRSFGAINIPLYFSYISSAEAYRSGLIIKGGAKFALSYLNNNAGKGTVRRTGVLQSTGIEIGKIVNVSDYFIPTQPLDTYIDKKATSPYSYRPSVFLFFSAAWIKPLGKGRNFITLGPSVEYAFNVSGANYKNIFGEEDSEAVSPLKIGFDITFNFKMSEE